MRAWIVWAVLAAVAAPVRADTLGGDDLARKNTGGYVTGLPLFAYSTDIGLGFGARAY
jgi:biotin transporter BioY